VARGLLNARALTFARSTHGIDPQRAQVVLREHRRILDALTARDPREATRAMQSHLRRSRKNLLRTLEESGERPS
jgi:DNA-binding GntR family transcriptional regulator